MQSNEIKDAYAGLARALAADHDAAERTSMRYVKSADRVLERQYRQGPGLKVS
jgi:hypothetical protein